MKTTSIAAVLVACSGLVAAAPSPTYDDGQYRPHPSDVKASWDYWKDGSNGGNNGGSDKPKKECKKKLKSPFDFTSTYFVTAVPGEVIATNQTAAPGQPGAVGYYNFGINSALDTICYNITLVGLQGDYQSPARTATHIHQAPRGRAGPPRIAFPNPVADANNANIRRSAGCLTGPFVTGVVTNGTDTGAGFTVAQIEQNPSAFFADVHTTLFVPGAVRGQLA